MGYLAASSVTAVAWLAYLVWVWRYLDQHDRDIGVFVAMLYGLMVAFFVWQLP